MATHPRQAPPAPPDPAPDPAPDTGLLPAPHLGAGQLHELHAGVEGWAAALLFALTQARDTAPLLLVRARAPVATLPCGDALAAMGLDPARLLIVQAQDTLALLRAAHEGARCPALGAVVIESWGPLREYDLVASRRLVLAAEGSGVPVILLRGDASPRPSAAHTRWQVATAPSRPPQITAPASPAQALASAPPAQSLISAFPAQALISAFPAQAQALANRLPGPATITLDLLRQRAGPAGQSWRLEWNDRNACFHPIPNPIPQPLPQPAPGFGAAMAGTVVSLSALRKDGAPPRHRRAA